MRVEEDVAEGVVLERQHAHIPVATCGGEVAAYFRWRPGDEIDRGGVQGEFVDSLPVIGGLFAVDEDAAVVGAAGEDGAVGWVGPGDAPDGAFVAAIANGVSISTLVYLSCSVVRNGAYLTP